MSEGSYPGGPTYGSPEDGEGQSTTVQVAERVQETARAATGQVAEKTQEVRGKAGGMVREQVNQRSTQAGEQISSVGQAMRKTGEQLRSDGNEPQANIAEQAAERIERLGDYLKEADADMLLGDIEAFGRRRPWVLALAGATLGLAAARFLKASSSQRYEQQKQVVFEPDTGYDRGVRTAATSPAGGFTGAGYDPLGPGAPGAVRGPAVGDVTGPGL